MPGRQAMWRNRVRKGWSRTRLVRWLHRHAILPLRRPPDAANRRRRRSHVLPGAAARLAVWGRGGERDAVAGASEIGVPPKNRGDRTRRRVRTLNYRRRISIRRGCITFGGLSRGCITPDGLTLPASAIAPSGVRSSARSTPARSGGASEISRTPSAPAVPNRYSCD